MKAIATREATCVGCGCTDRRACLGGCSWLAVNRDDGTGVCSNCRGALAAWREQQAAALSRDDFAWLVVKAACETEPADEDDPECIRILRLDLKSAVLAAFLQRDADWAKAKEGGVDA
ncbi:MAG: hypothetical protein EPN34_03115 [Burkholderiaceae bacterium]|nr:MAG: hypothetical protein EPN34_03115 [Burkholderiaceae bacterium]